MEARTNHGDDERDLIRIELRLDGSSPTGSATAERGGTRGFTGWLGLMSAVDALAADNADGIGPREGSNGDARG